MFLERSIVERSILSTAKYANAPFRKRDPRSTEPAADIRPQLRLPPELILLRSTAALTTIRTFIS